MIDLPLAAPGHNMRGSAPWIVRNLSVTSSMPGGGVMPTRLPTGSRTTPFTTTSPWNGWRGRGAIRDLVSTWYAGLAGIDFAFSHIVAEGDVVLMEREDVVPRPAGTMRLPIMGVIEFRGDKIAAWREYFDVTRVEAMLRETAGIT